MYPATEFLKNKIGETQPEIGLVLGSGLNFLADERMQPDKIIPYREIPGFPKATSIGHKGNLVFGGLGERSVVCMQGRFHFFEGHSMEDVIKPIRVMSQLGVKIIILTNAAGGINESFSPGTLMLITDHINLLGTNPLVGKNIEEFGPRFPDMTFVYDREVRSLAHIVAESLSLELKEGVYLATTGPSFETPAEIRAFRSLGADAVGMSTVPEAIAANHAGLRVCGISCISNMAAGMSGVRLTHEEVEETAGCVKAQFADLIDGLVENLSN